MNFITCPTLAGFEKYRIAVTNCDHRGFVDVPNKTVYELKPNNPRSISRGKKQLDKYAKGLSKKFGGKWKKVLDLY